MSAKNLEKTPLLSVVVVEDDPLLQSVFKHLLSEIHFSIFPHLDAFLDSPQNSQKWDLMLLDLCHAGDPKGKATLSRIPLVRTLYPDTELIIQSGLNEVEIMRDCVKLGASRFILKDHINDEIPALLNWQAEFKNQAESLNQSLVGSSEVMRRLKRDLLSLRFENSVNVLIEGETGTGKELSARALHHSGPFVGVNVSAIPPDLFESEFFGAEKGAFTGAHVARDGHFEAAGQGTLFLDEIQTLSLAHQAKLLRVLETRTFSRIGSSQERPLKARILSASNQNLREAVSRGKFREDLYFRLAPLAVQVPPLRIRGKDISELAQIFLKEADGSKNKSFSKQGLEFLENSYDWPGNVRELKSLIKRIVIKSQIPVIDSPEIEEFLGSQNGVTESYLGELVKPEPDHGDHYQIDWNLAFDANVENFEKFMLGKVLAKFNPTEARNKMAMARSRFYDKIKQYGLLKKESV